MNEIFFKIKFFTILCGEWNQFRRFEERNFFS